MIKVIPLWPLWSENSFFFRVIFFGSFDDR